MIPQDRDDAEIVVLEGVPEVANFDEKQFEPGPEVVFYVGFGLPRPIRGYFRTLQRSASRFFSGRDRIFQHRFLARMQAGRKAGISGGERIVADPKIDAAVRGKENGVARNEVVVDPARRRPNSDADEDEADGRALGEPNTAPVSCPVPLKEERDEKKWHQKQNRGDPHRREPD